MGYKSAKKKLNRSVGIDNHPPLKHYRLCEVVDHLQAEGSACFHRSTTSIELVEFVEAISRQFGQQIKFRIFSQIAANGQKTKVLMIDPSTPIRSYA